MRKLQNGALAEQLDENVTLIVYTKCPSKYKLIDMETGQEYVGQDPRHNNQHWSIINDQR